MLILEIALGIAFGVALVPWAFRFIQGTINALALCRYQFGLAARAARPWMWFLIGWLVLEWLAGIYGPPPHVPHATSFDMSIPPLR